MTLYNATMNLANSMGCSFDEAFFWFVLFLMIFFVFFGWSINFLMDCGSSLYIVTKKFFTLLRGALRRVVLYIRRP